MSLIIPDSRFEAPELYIPGRKPQPPYEIDWDHPRTKGLALCVMWDNGGVDLVTGKRLTVSGATKGSDYWSFDGTDDYASIPLNLSGETVVTVATGFDWSSYANDDDFYCEHTPDGNSNSAFNIDPNSSTGSFALAVTYYSGSPFYVLGAFARPSAGYHDYVFRMKRQQSSLGALVDGVEQSLSYSVLNQSQVNGTSYVDSTLYFNSRGGSSLFGASKNKYFFLWKRDLWGQEAKEINRNPYQFLIPA